GKEQGSILELRDTVWAQPVVVKGKKKVSIGLWAKDGQDEGEIEYEIYSEREGEEKEGENEEIVHCQGRGVWRRGGKLAKVDVEKLKEEMSEGKVEGERVYRACAGQGVVYGGSMQAIHELYRGRGQVLAQLRLPREVESGWQEYVLHPSLLDGALQASVGLMDEWREEGVRAAEEGVRLPFGLEV